MKKKQVSDFGMSRLALSAHSSFHNMVATTLVEIGDENLGLAPGFTSKYRKAITTEQDLVRKVYGSAQTPLLEEQDMERIKRFRAIRNTLRLTKYSSNAELNGLYPTIYKYLIKPYPARVCDGLAHLRSSQFAGFIMDVKQYLTEGQRNKLNIAADLEAMEMANEAYIGIFLSRVEEHVQNPAGISEVYRAETDACWNQLVRTLEYYHGEENSTSEETQAIAANVVAYVQTLNRLISEFLASLKRKKPSTGNGNDNAGQSPDDNDNGNTGQNPDDNKPSTGDLNEKPAVNAGTTDKEVLDKPVTDKENNTGMGGDL